MRQTNGCSHSSPVFTSFPRVAFQFDQWAQRKSVVIKRNHIFFIPGIASTFYYPPGKDRLCHLPVSWWGVPKSLSHQNAGDAPTGYGQPMYSHLWAKCIWLIFQQFTIRWWYAGKITAYTSCNQREVIILLRAFFGNQENKSMQPNRFRYQRMERFPVIGEPIFSDLTSVSIAFRFNTPNKSAHSVSFIKPLATSLYTISISTGRFWEKPVKSYDSR